MSSERLRRSSRIPKEIPILLVGSDMEGKTFSEKAKTVLLSRHGAGIVSEYKLSPEQELILRSLETNKETDARGGPARLRRRELHLRRGVSGPEHRLLGHGVPAHIAIGERCKPRRAAVRQLQSARDGPTERPGIGRLYGQRRDCAVLQELRFFHVLEAGGRCRRRRSRPTANRRGARLLRTAGARVH